MSDDVDAGAPAAAPPPPAGDEPRAWRVTFGYRGDDIRVLARQRVAMTAPPDDSARTFAARAGTWVAVQDGSGHGLYRQILSDPVRGGYEAHAGDASRHARPAEPEGVFQVVVPDLPDGADVVLYRLADDSARAAAVPADAVAVPVAQAPLQETDPFEVT